MTRTMKQPASTPMTRSGHRPFWTPSRRLLGAVTIWINAGLAHATVPVPAPDRPADPEAELPELTDRMKFGALRSLADSDNAGVAGEFVTLARETGEPALRRDAMFNAGLLLARSSVATWRRPPMPGPDGSPPPPTPFEQIRAQLVDSADRFRAAYREDPADADAARHLELVRRLIRQLDEEREQRAQQNQERSNLADKLDELAEQQERLADQSEQATSDDAEGLAQQQSALDQQTQETLDRLESLDREQQRSSDPDQADPGEAAERAREARAAQERAQEELSDRLTKPASEAQREAAEKLREAAEAAREQAQQGEQSEQQEQSEDAGQDAEQQESDQSEQPSERQDDGEPADPTEELLDELDDQEQQNRERRDAIRRSLPSRSAPVERDW